MVNDPLRFNPLIRLPDSVPWKVVEAPVELGDRFLNWAYEPDPPTLTDLIVEDRSLKSTIAHEAKHIGIGFFVPFHSTLRHVYGDLRNEPMDWKVWAFDLAYAPSTIAFDIAMIRLVVGLAVPGAAAATLLPAALSVFLGRVESTIATPRDVILPAMALADALHKIWNREGSFAEVGIDLLFFSLGVRNHTRRGRIKNQIMGIADDIHPDWMDHHYHRALSPEAKAMPRTVSVGERYIPNVTTFQTGAPARLSWMANLRQHIETFWCIFIGRQVRLPRSENYSPFLQVYGRVVQRANRAAFHYDGIEPLIRTVAWSRDPKKNPLIKFASQHGQGLWDVFAQQEVMRGYLLWLREHAQILERALHHGGTHLSPNEFKHMIERHPIVRALQEVARTRGVTAEFVASQLKRTTGPRRPREAIRRIFERRLTHTTQDQLAARAALNLHERGIPDDPEFLLGLLKNHNAAVTVTERASELRMSVGELGDSMVSSMGHPRMDADVVNFRDFIGVWAIRMGEVLDRVGLFWTQRNRWFLRLSRKVRIPLDVQGMNARLRRYQPRSFFTDARAPAWKRFLTRIGWFVRDPNEFRPQANSLAKAEDIVDGALTYLVFPDGGRTNLTVNLAGRPTPSLLGTRKHSGNPAQVLTRGDGFLSVDTALVLRQRGSERPLYVVPLGYEGMVSPNLSKIPPFIQPNLTEQAAILRIGEAIPVRLAAGPVTKPLFGKKTGLSPAEEAYHTLVEEVNAKIEAGLRKAGRLEERVAAEIFPEWIQNGLIGENAIGEMMSGIGKIMNLLRLTPAAARSRSATWDPYIMAARMRLLRPEHQREMIPEYVRIFREAVAIDTMADDAAEALLGTIERLHKAILSKAFKKGRVRPFSDEVRLFG